DLLVQGGREDFLPLLPPSDLDDQLRRDLPRRAVDVVLARVPFVQVHADQLDLHRRQAEIVDVLDSVPQGPPLAGQWDARRPKTNPHLQRVVRELREVSREAGGAIWRDVADRLERSRKNWSEVNLSRLSRYAAKGEQIVVPGVVLATGEISTPLTVAAFRASGAARKKIEAAGGKAISLLELAVQNPKGSGVRIMG